MNNSSTVSLRPVPVKIAAGLLVACTMFAQIFIASRVHFDGPLKYVLMAIMTSIPLLMAWLLYTGRNWARWTFVAVVVWTLFLSPGIVHRQQTHSTFQAAFYCFQTLIQVICAALLCLPSSNRWFKQGRSLSNQSP
jgi:hypothetical protein